MANIIKIVIKIDKPLEKVWEFWTKPEHIVKWNFASDDWECPAVENDLRVGGKFTYVMAAKDGSAKFDFTGTYLNVLENEVIEYELDDGRKVEIQFIDENNATKLIESFEVEGTNSGEQQKSGWQSILNNLKKYAENQ